MPDRDYCTFWFDKIFGVCIADCCKEHDEGYALGGTYVDRLLRDWELRQCVSAKGGFKFTAVSWIMYIGVRVGASRLGCKILNGGKQRFKWVR